MEISINWLENGVVAW